MSRTEYFRKPNGDVVTDVYDYAKDWKALYEPIEKATGFKVIGFDPGILMCTITPDKEDPKIGHYSKSVDLTVEFAQAILKIINENENHINERRSTPTS